MKTLVYGFFLVVLFFFFVGVAQAKDITFRFSGSVVSISDNSGALVGTGISTSSTFTGYFSYDSDATPTHSYTYGAIYLEMSTEK